MYFNRFLTAKLFLKYPWKTFIKSPKWFSVGPGHAALQLTARKGSTSKWISSLLMWLGELPIKLFFSELRTTLCISLGAKETTNLQGQTAVLLPLERRKEDTQKHLLLKTVCWSDHWKSTCGARRRYQFSAILGGLYFVKQNNKIYSLSSC